MAAVALAGIGDRFVYVLPGLAPVAYAVVGAVIVHHQRGNRIGWLLCAGSIPFALLNTGSEYAYRAVIGESASLPAVTFVESSINVLPFLGLGLLVALLPQLFPTGTAISQRWRPTLWAAWGFIATGTISNLLIAEKIQGLPDVDNPTAIAAAQPLASALGVAALICLVLSVGAGLAGLVVRWRRSAVDERQQLKWFLAGVAPLLVPMALHDVLPVLAGAVIALLLPLVPITIGVAVLRYRLYDLDIVINRVLVYTTLSTMIAAVYLAIVVVVETVVGWGQGLGVQVAATVASAALFQPLRARVQRGIDRMFFGDRARPYEALTRLGRRLERAPAPQATLYGVVDTVADAMRVPYASIELAIADTIVTAAEHGTPTDEPARFPMIYQDEIIGHLTVSRRGPGADFSAADRRLLADLARHAGVAAHATQVTTALQQARLALVTAREEERRRLRRDLHDGLGPALAGVTLGLHAAQATIPTRPDHAAALLAGIQTQVEDVVRDIRRLVYGLRPPALDEYGLYRALQQHAAKIENEDRANGLAITVAAPATGLGALPAAVEVAAYRIATEAMTNVSHHAHARACHISLNLDGALQLDIIDDGRGLPAGTPAGVGLNAMRERAAELGGDLSITASGAGTHVRARLPIPELS
ncbi:sensor histidine kinase [Micromonospora inositola]|nr:GAF domain-containing sensor histidine kinase [Micromonospora inositola]